MQSLLTEEEKKPKMSYYSLFKIKEIENSKLLQIVFYVVTLSFFVTFYGWVEQIAISKSSFIKGSHLCPPYFQNCGDYYFLEAQPYGYSQSFFYVLLFLLLFYGIISALKKDWVSAHKVIFIALVWKIIYIFFLTYGYGGNFDYYDMVVAFVWLFLTQKEYFLKVAFVVLYFIAATIKIHEGWILGNYFTALVTGAPIFTNEVVPLFTNVVILMQIVGCWFLLSNKKNIQRAAFIYFLLFHVYSGILVNYRYITISIPVLILLFGQNIKLFQIDQNYGDRLFTILKISSKTFFGYLFVLSLIFLQGIGPLIPGDQKKTLEGNFYGLYMFEANHQCISTSKIIYKNNIFKEKISTNTVAKNRCDPYQHWYRLKTLCLRDKNIKNIQWTFDHSINGHKYQRVVSEENICELTYSSLKHNTWIKIGSDAFFLPDPVYKNGYSRNLYSESYIIPTSPLEERRAVPLKIFYESLWWTTLIWVIFLLIKKQKNDN